MKTSFVYAKTYEIEHCAPLVSTKICVLLSFHFQVNRSSMTFLARQAFAKMFNSDPDDLVNILNLTL
jgi:hypothetical protein